MREVQEQESAMNNNYAALKEAAIGLLKELIAVPSFSREEAGTAEIIRSFLSRAGVACSAIGNNVYAVNLHFDAGKPTLLLNSHHDTVRPNPGYTRDPFAAQIEEGKLFGLGSNDAGGPLVALMSTFLNFYRKEGGAYNLMLAATAEEEISGKGGIEGLLPHLPPVAAAIVGEPTGMALAIAERGLMVVDGIAYGIAGPCGEG